MPSNPKFHPTPLPTMTLRSSPSLPVSLPYHHQALRPIQAPVSLLTNLNLPVAGSMLALACTAIDSANLFPRYLSSPEAVASIPALDQDLHRYYPIQSYPMRSEDSLAFLVHRPLLPLAKPALPHQSCPSVHSVALPIVFPNQLSSSPTEKFLIRYPTYALKPLFPDPTVLADSLLSTSAAVALWLS